MTQTPTRTTKIGNGHHDNKPRYHPLALHFYIVKLGFIGVYMCFLTLLQNIDCGFSFGPASRVPAIIVLSTNKKIIIFFQQKIVIFAAKKAQYIV